MAVGMYARALVGHIWAPSRGFKLLGARARACMWRDGGQRRVDEGGACLVSESVSVKVPYRCVSCPRARAALGAAVRAVRRAGVRPSLTLHIYLPR